MSTRNQIKTTEPGTLYVVATPIGNLSDLSPRALECLRNTDLILAEDTREFRKLAGRFQILTHVISYHDHNERTRTPAIIEKLSCGASAALVSDAGTPLISDPGYHLIRAAHQARIPVRTVPGPCSVTGALSISGLPANAFTFLGFLPQKKGKRDRVLKTALAAGTTVVFFESPFRIAATVKTIAGILPQCDLFIARELTKLHEETFFGKAADVTLELEQRARLRGEFVVVLHPNDSGLECATD